MISFRIFLNLTENEAATVSQLELLLQMKLFFNILSFFFRFLTAVYYWFTSCVWGCQVISMEPPNHPFIAMFFTTLQLILYFLHYLTISLVFQFCLNLQSMFPFEHAVFKLFCFTNFIAL